MGPKLCGLHSILDGLVRLRPKLYYLNRCQPWLPLVAYIVLQHYSQALDDIVFSLRPFSLEMVCLAPNNTRSGSEHNAWDRMDIDSGQQGTIFSRCSLELFPGPIEFEFSTQYLL